jgi:hypothetical protein
VTAPADGRCGLTPTKLVDASTYPVPTGVTKVGVDSLAVDGPDLYYVTFSLDSAGGIFSVAKAAHGPFFQ